MYDSPTGTFPLGTIHEQPKQEYERILGPIDDEATNPDGTTAVVRSGIWESAFDTNSAITRGIPIGVYKPDPPHRRRVVLASYRLDGHVQKRTVMSDRNGQEIQVPTFPKGTPSYNNRMAGYVTNNGGSINLDNIIPTEDFQGLNSINFGAKLFEKLDAQGLIHKTGWTSDADRASKMWLIGLVNKLIIDREEGKYHDFRGIFDNSRLDNADIHSIVTEGYAILVPLMRILNDRMKKLCEVEAGSIGEGRLLGSDVMATIAMIAGDLTFIRQKRGMSPRWQKEKCSTVERLEPKILPRALDKYPMDVSRILGGVVSFDHPDRAVDIDNADHSGNLVDVTICTTVTVEVPLVGARSHPRNRPTGAKVRSGPKAGRGANGQAQTISTELLPGCNTRTRFD